jgi:hypothetical protein
VTKEEEKRERKQEQEDRQNKNTERDEEKWKRGKPKKEKTSLIPWYLPVVLVFIFIVRAPTWSRRRGDSNSKTDKHHAQTCPADVSLANN